MVRPSTCTPRSNAPVDQALAKAYNGASIGGVIFSALWVALIDQFGFTVASALFGAGIGNATSLPPLIAQTEFAKEDVQRVVAMTVATAQATYAFAPTVFGVVLVWSGGAAPRIGDGAFTFLVAVGVVQVAAIACYLAGPAGPASTREILKNLISCMCCPRSWRRLPLRPCL